MDAIGQENTESLQELLENLPLLEQMNQENAAEEIVVPAATIIEYTQEQICEMTGVRPYLLRFWESEFEEIHPQIREDGQKIYSEDDLITIQRVRVLLMEEKLTIERARHLLRKERIQAAVPVAEIAVIDKIDADPVNLAVVPLETQMMEDTINDSPENEVSGEVPMIPTELLALEVMNNSAENDSHISSLIQAEDELIVNQDAMEMSTLDDEKVIAQLVVADPELEINEMMCEPNVVEVEPMAKDKSLVKTAFVTRFQKNEVGPGPAGVQLAQDLAIARAQSQMVQQSVLQHSPQVDTLMEKRDELNQIKNKLEGLILEIKLKRNIVTGNC